jgi:hypothetical protein
VTSYTASGARRTGDEYQDLQSAEIFIEWLEQPDSYHWVRLETMDGSLDDIQAERADGTIRLLQVKFGTDPSIEWTLDELIEQKSGKKGNKPSLLQKWKTSLDNVAASGAKVSEAALITNRHASATIRAHLLDSGLIDFRGFSPSLQETIANQLGGITHASSFFAAFHFFFRDRMPEVLDVALQERFSRLGGTNEGWWSLITKIRRWINRKDEPNPNGVITLQDVRAAALWHIPPQIPQGFLVPDDYIAPEVWSHTKVEPRLGVGGDRMVVVTGSPGSGKSTYLSWLVAHLRKADIPVVRHHYFLSLTDATSYRTAWETAAEAIIGQLRSSFEKLVRAVQHQNPLPETIREYLVAAGRERVGIDPLVVIIDGLDHVWRDTGSAEGLRRLFDLLLPSPDGVVVVVGTQDIEFTRIPRKLRDLCPRDQWLDVPVLDGEMVHSWLQHHRKELGLPENGDHANKVFSELADAFLAVSGGHPLVLHYTLSAARQGSPSINPEKVRALPPLSPNSSVANYYKALWDDISPEGHQLIHLLAAFPWAWPRNGLMECLAPQTDHVRLEKAERAIRHVLGTSRIGVTAFHESLLAFVREIPEHQSAALTLRPHVVDWLTHRAPEYWKWRYEWEERARNGDTDPLISSVTLEWCVDSLTAGRGRSEIGEVIAASGWASLEACRLGVATERHYIGVYLTNADAESALWRLIWLALLNRDPASREIEFNLFLSRMKQATEREIEAVTEIAFLAGWYDICEDLLSECGERWNSVQRHSQQIDDNSLSLKNSLPTLIAASLTILSEGPYQRYVVKHSSEPDWCSGGRYAKALARLCALGDDTRALRQELRFLANNGNRVTFEAVDEIVRLSCREGFNTDQWIENTEARKSGLFRCHRLWVQRVIEVLADAPQEVSFLQIQQKYFGQGEVAFVELARAYFFSCLAIEAEGRDHQVPVGLDSRASKVAGFLSLLRDIATEAVASKTAGKAIGGAWLITKLATIEPPKVEVNDYDNGLVRSGPLARIVVAIAQDLEELHYAETGETSLTQGIILEAVKGAWTWDRVWIEDRVDRRLMMRDFEAVQLLIDRERNRLDTSRDYLHTRAEDYASLAQFCQLHQGAADGVRALSRLAARNLLGHGYHKDLILDDLLRGIRVAFRAGKRYGLESLRAISPVIQVVDEITDGDETNHLKGELAEVVWEIAPEALPPYLRALQHAHHHAAVESCFTDLARSLPLRTPFERALASTLVHEEGLSTLQERAEIGDSEAASVLTNILTDCGRQTIAPKRSETESHIPVVSVDNHLPPIQDFPPERLTEFVRAVRDAKNFGETHLAAWTSYWRFKEPDRLLAAIKTYCEVQGFPHEKKSARAIVELALERSGRGAAWDWLIVYHNAVYGWSRYSYPLNNVEWIWEFVRARFKERWLDFIKATSGPPRRSAGGSPGWSIERMVRFLSEIDEKDRIDEVIEAVFRWGAGLAADMRLPDPALTPDQPDLPVALRLLVDRLDCPSRMVQERAAWVLAGLLANSDTRDATSTALIDWHKVDSMELHSCTLLLILHLARTANGLTNSDCAKFIRQTNIVPSIGADLLMREFEDEEKMHVELLNYRKSHSGTPASNFSGVRDFDHTVKGHLAPIFLDWASQLDKAGIPFSRQWESEAVELANQQGLSLRLNAHFSYHYRGGVDDATLAINDRLSLVLRSAYLRALHWSIDEAAVDVNRAEIHARRVAVLADPVLWAVRPSKCPVWWPKDSNNENGLDILSESVGQAFRNRVENRDSNEGEILLFAAGPVGNRPRFRAELVIRAYLQAAYGPLKPTQEELATIPWVVCRPIPPRLSLPGTYMTFEDDKYAEFVSHWLMAPLVWRLLPNTEDWLLPDRQARGLHMPATWLLHGVPSIQSGGGKIQVLIGDQHVAYYRYWNDELRERHYLGSSARVGGELLIRREWLEPQLKSGATLCWVATLTIAQREEYKQHFGKPQLVGTWGIGGSRIVWPDPWQPQFG